MKISLLILLIVVVVTPANGQPVRGIHSLMDGRLTESWNGGGEGRVGNTLNIASWDGETLGSQWALSCQTMFTIPVLIFDGRDGTGTGEIIYSTIYLGGDFYISSVGPWSNSVDSDFNGVSGFTRVISTFLYVHGTRVTVRLHIMVYGEFSHYPEVFEFNINNASFLGYTGPLELPSGYPDFLDSSCQPGSADGGIWGDVQDVSIGIDISGPVDNTTWGRIKAMYR